MEKSKTKIKLSMFFNIIISILTACGFFITFTGITFSKGADSLMESSNLEVFKFFTVDSNLMMGIIALVFMIEEYKLLKGKIDSISANLYKAKFMSTVAVALTFTVVFIYLGPTSSGGIPSMLMNSNLFFHLIIPVLSMNSFMFIEKSNILSIKDTFLGLIPMLLYSVFYAINIFIHMENGFVSPIYDFYWFVQNGIWTIFIVAPLIMLLTYILSVIIWKFNKVNN